MPATPFLAGGRPGGRRRARPPVTSQASVSPLSGQVQTTDERTEPVYQLTAIYTYPESLEAFVVLRSGVLDLQTAQNLCGNGHVALNDPDHTYGSVK